MLVAAMMIPLPGSFVPLVVLMSKLGLVNTRIGYVLCMISVGLSVSRVGGNAQIPAMKKDAGALRINLAQHRELA